MKYLFNFLVFVSLVVGSLSASEFTFFLSSDPHYGYHQWNEQEKVNGQAIKDMNKLPGQKYENSGEVVKKPKGVLVSGDLSGNGSLFNWAGYWLLKWYPGFDTDYEVNGNGALKYPVFEGYGNHDIHTKGNDAIIKGIKYRNRSRSEPINVSTNGLHYSWNWEGVHFVNANLYPGGKGDAQNSLEFLKKDLSAKVGQTRQPIILYFHYDLRASDRWWTQAEKEAFYQVIKDYNVIGIFVGHSHSMAWYKWHGIPVFNAPAVMDHASYFVVRVKEDRIIVSTRKDGKWIKEWSSPYAIK